MRHTGEISTLKENFSLMSLLFLPLCMCMTDILSRSYQKMKEISRLPKQSPWQAAQKVHLLKQTENAKGLSYYCSSMIETCKRTLLFSHVLTSWLSRTGPLLRVPAEPPSTPLSEVHSSASGICPKGSEARIYLHVFICSTYSHSS